MASQADKIWNRPWTMEEIMENADNWTLAGDAALLNTLKSFANNMFQKTGSITNNIDSLLNNLDEVQLKLDITQNEFHSLKNSQFIESRVYEDDETLDSKEDKKLIVKQMTEEDQEKFIFESIKTGLDIMQKYYDNVEVSISDSEDESERSYIIKPKDVYTHRPLPPLIGSKNWDKKWHMEDTSSDSESEKGSEIYSESDSDNELPKDLLKGSETSSELDFSSHTSESRPIDNSTFNEPSKITHSITSSEGSNGFQESEPVKVPTMNKTLAEQLTTRLGHITSEQEDTTYQEVNKRPIRPVKSDFIDYLFSDKPPPLDDIDGDESAKPSHLGIFSGGHGLFDDDEEEFWEQSNKETKISKDGEFTIKEKADSNFASKKFDDITTSKSTQHVSKGLFDSDNDSTEEDLFSSKFKQHSLERQEKKTYHSNVAAEVDKEQQPPEEILKKKPVGGVLLCGSLDIFNNQQVKNILRNKGEIQVNPTVAEKIEDKNEVMNINKSQLFEENKSVIVDSTLNKKKRLILFEDDDDNNNDDDAKVMSKVKKNQFESKANKSNDESKSRNTKKISLFDDDDNDDDDLMKNDLFSSNPSKSSNLFNNLAENDDIFSIKNKTKSEAIAKNDVDSLFSHFDEKHEDKFLGLSIERDVNTKFNTANMKSESKATGKNTLFNEPEEGEYSYFEQPITTKTDVEHEVVAVRTDNLTLSDKETKKIEFVTGSRNNIFDENSDDAPLEQPESVSDQLDKSIIPEAISKLDDIFEKSVIPPRIENKLDISLFGSTPPPVDDDEDWDTKSDNSNSGDFQSYHMEDDDRLSDLFDNEPPSLCFNDTSGIVKDFTNTRMDTDDTSFNPHTSSSRRPSSDIFNDQQSQDNFYVTKVPITSVLFPPDLGLIHETSDTSIMNITPSGDVDIFEATKDKKIEQDKNLVAKSEANKYMRELSKSTTEIDHERGIIKQDIKGSEFDGQIIRGSVECSDHNESVFNKSENTFPEPKSSISKLKQNLHINVNALRPGLPRPEIKQISSNQSLTGRNKDSSIEESNIPSRTMVSIEKAVTFEDDVRNVECLPSITKDRVKIPIKRKPSTRRGRHEAMRKSAADLTLDIDNFNQAQKVPAVSALNPDVLSMNEDACYVEKGKDQVNWIENTDTFDGGIENDKHLVTLFGSSKMEESSSSLSPPIIANKKSVKSSNIFSEGDNDEELFSSTSKKSSSNKSKLSLFDSEDDTETDLFGKNTKSSKLALGSNKMTKSEPPKKKIIFDDSSSDDDLFSVNSSNNKSKHQGSSASINKKPQRPPVVRKLENVEARDNPLSDIFK